MLLGPEVIPGHPVLGLQVHTALPGSYMGAGYSNPGPHVCTARECFTTSCLPSPLFHFLNHFPACFISSRHSPSWATITTQCCFQTFPSLRSSTKHLYSELSRPWSLGMLKHAQLCQSMNIITHPLPNCLQERMEFAF